MNFWDISDLFQGCSKGILGFKIPRKMRNFAP